MPKTISIDDARSRRFFINELFTPSSPVRLAELFAGRTVHINQVLDAIAEPGRHAIIYGERGVGKTSLAKVIELLIPSLNRRVKYQRKSCAPDDNFTSIWRKFFETMEFRSEETGNQHSVSEIYPNNITINDVVNELKHFSVNDIPIFVIDEFNEVEDEQTRILMANLIKALSDDVVNSTVVIVGVGENVIDLFDDHESIERCTEEVPMPRMTQNEIGEILDKRLGQLDMRIDADARWKILVLSRGLPTYTHRLGKHAALRANTDLRTNITEDDVDGAVEKILQSSLQSLRNKYQMATSSHQPGNLFKEVLLACAITRSDDNGYFKPAYISEPLTGLVKRNMQIANYQNHLTLFISEERGQVLQRIGGERAYKFRFRDPAMLPYVIMKGLQSGMVGDDVKSVLSYPEQPDFFPNA